MGLTQSELADRLYVTDRAISKWEMGHSVPELDKLISIADIFSTTLDMLVGYDESARKKAFIGIDGGATKTEFVLFTESGHILKRVCLDGSNPNVCGIDTSCNVLKSGIDKLLDTQCVVEGIFGGIAGFRSGNNAQLLNDFIKKTYPLIKSTFDSDICNVQSSDGYVGNCAVVICGTGFAVYANENNILNRVGSWGYLLDDISGGYTLGREALRAALAQRDGFGKETIITHLVEQRLGGEVWNCINDIYRKGDSYIASFASVIFEAYRQGDCFASEILDTYVTKMKNLLEFTLKKYDCKSRIIISGGLTSEGTIINLLKEKMGSDVCITVPNSPQVCGACYKCCEMYGTPDDEFLNNIKKSYMNI